jgi:hypothetical protein
MGLVQSLGNPAIEDPDLLTPIIACVVQFRAGITLARAEAVRLAEID